MICYSYVDVFDRLLLDGLGLCIHLYKTARKNTPIKKFLTSFFWWVICFDKMISTLRILLPKILICCLNAFFLIFPIVKILSPLARVKMKRAELFSESGASTHVFWSCRELWNSVSFWGGSFTFIYFQWRVFLKKVLSFEIFSAQSSHFQRAVILFTVRYNFKNLVVWRNFQRRIFEKALGNGEKDGAFRMKC